MRKLILFLGVLLLTLGLVVGSAGATLHVVKDVGGTYILYEDEEGTDIMKIDDDDGVSITSYTTVNTYTTMTLTSTLDASSLTAGSFVTPGGIACAKQLYLGDDLDMSVSTTSGTYDITLLTNKADALSIVDTAPGDLIVFCTTTGSQLITITPATTITGALTATGGITAGAAVTVGSSGTGWDVTFYGETAGSDFLWDEDGDSDDSILSLGDTAGSKGVDFIVYGDTATTYLKWDQSTDDLLLVGTATQLHIAGTTASTNATSGSLKTAGGLGVAGACFIAGAVEIGVDDTGTDFTVYGDTTLYEVMWDASGDTNGAWYFGTDTKGVLVTLYGAVTGTGVFWDPDGDTNGVLSIGASGGSAGVDCIMYGTTNNKYWKWDRSADEVMLTGDMVIAPIAAGTFLDFVLATEWVSGTLINAACASGTTFDDDVVGMLLDFNSNVTMTTDKDVIAYQVELPALTQASANTTLITAFDILTAGALVQQTLEGTITWKGIDIQLPNTTQTTGTVNSYGIYVTAGTVTTGSQYGIYFPAGTLTTAIALAGTSTDGIAFSGTVTDEVIQIGGTYDHGIRFTEDPVAADVTNSFINIGDYTTGIAVAPTTANMFGVMHNVTLAVNVAYWYQAYYTKITTSGTTTSTSIAGHALRMQVATSLEAVYGIQCHTNISAGADVTQEVVSVSAYVSLGTGETTSDRVVALQAMITGSGTAGTVVGDAIVGYFVNAGTVVTTDDIIKVYNQSAATVVDGIEIENDGTMTNAIKINNDLTCSVGILFEGTHTVGLDLNGSYTTAGISMDGATFAALDNEIEMRNTVTGDKTVIASGSAADDAAMVAAVGADADIADGSLYLQVIDGAGALYIKKNDVWTAFTNP